LSIRPKEEKYKKIGLISNRGWTSDRAAEDLGWAQRCKEGSFISLDGDDWFCCGFEGSPGIIEVENGDKAYVVDAYESKGKPYLVLELDELIDFIIQLKNYLVSIEK
jgi:hypothetical protein